jgi:hypothetical protein
MIEIGFLLWHKDMAVDTVTIPATTNQKPLHVQMINKGLVSDNTSHNKSETSACFDLTNRTSILSTRKEGSDGIKGVNKTSWTTIFVRFHDFLFIEKDQNRFLWKQTNIFKVCKKELFLESQSHLKMINKGSVLFS